MSCTTGRHRVEFATVELETIGSPTPTAAPLQRIEHGLKTAFEQMEEVSLVLAENTSKLLVVPLEQVALAARVGAVMSDLRVLRQSLGTLVLRERTPSPA